MSYQIYTIVSYIREPLPTSNVLALMRLLASVSTDVNSECASLDEAFATTRCHARIWSFICVDSIMSLKIRFAIETL